MADAKSKSQEINQIDKTDEIETLKSSSSEQVESDEKVITAYIDRIEEVENGESKAVIYVDDDESEELPKIVLPVSLLPNEIYEGDYILIKISYDKEKSESK